MLAALLAHAQTFAPGITTQPASSNLLPGANAQFSVIVTGTPPISYRWRKAETALTDAGNLQGATTSTLTITNLTAANASFYDVVATNAFGSVTSRVVELSVNLAKPDSFDPNASGSSSSAVIALIPQADGKVLVGGDFTSIGGLPSSFLARLHADGGLDTSFNPNCNARLKSLVVQADGKVLAGGMFTYMGGQPRNRIARLNADGSLDGAFDPNASEAVYPIVLQADEKVLVGGRFNNLSGQPRNYIARLHTDGRLDTTFNPDASDRIYSIAVQADGKVWVGGVFTNICGQPRNRIARLHADGSLDNTFNAIVEGYAAYPYIYSLAIQADGKILIGGSFTNLCGQKRNNIARLDVDGSLDHTFDPDANNAVETLSIQADGKLLIGGSFTSISGQPRNAIARLNADGSLDSTFNPDAGEPNHRHVWSLSLQTDGKVLVGGWFASVGGQPRNLIARLNATEPATQSLQEWNGVAISWRRGGTAPEVLRTAFEFSTNGTDWIILGAGERFPGGWQLTGLSLSYNATIRARGYTVGGQFNDSSWFVETGLGPPAITRQPQPTFQSVKTTALATFDVGVVGTEPFSYQWYENREFSTNAIPGATNSVLTLANLEGHEAWQYWVTVSNALGTVTSRPVSLRVIGRPALSSHSFSATNGAWNWSFFAQTGAVYTIQATPTLLQPAWVNTQSYTGDNSQISLTNTIPLNSNQFFRLKIE
jgi:uncharacterized delta-60 repeat protein